VLIRERGRFDEPAADVAAVPTCNVCSNPAYVKFLHRFTRAVLKAESDWKIKLYGDY